MRAGLLRRPAVESSLCELCDSALIVVPAYRSYERDLICTPDHSSRTLAMHVKSDVAPYFACVTASI